MPPVGAVFNRTVSACPDYRDPDRSGLETAPTQHGERQIESLNFNDKPMDSQQ